VIARGLAPQGSEDSVVITRPGAAGVYGGLRRTSRLPATDLYQLTHCCYGIKSDFERAELDGVGAVTGTPVTTRLAK
jgi:hypothetical protein